MNKIFSAAILALISSGANALVIDDYVTSQMIEVTATAPPDQTAGSSVAATVLGGERDVLLTKTLGANDDRVRARFNPNGLHRMRFSSDSGVNGVAQVVYDGLDNDPGIINYTGLGGVNLLADGADSFRLDVLFSNIAGPVRVFVYDSNDATGNTFVSGVINVPGAVAPSMPQTLFLNFNNLMSSNTTPVFDILSSAGAIVTQIDGSAAPDQSAWDADFALFGTENAATFNVPVPTAAMMFAIGLLGLRISRSKKQAILEGAS